MMDIFKRLEIKIQPGKPGSISKNFFKMKELVSEMLKDYPKSEEKVTLATEIEKRVWEDKYGNNC